MKVSTCCGATDRPTSDDGPSYEDVGFCSECKDHTDYVEVCEECSEEVCVCEPSGPSVPPQAGAYITPDIDPVNVLLAKSAAFIGIMCIAAFIAGFMTGGIGR
jgi:predicted amidophosphoribosyltransferase